MQHDACVRRDGDSWLLERCPVQERMSSNFGRCDRIKCPYGQVGDTLWVKETWKPAWSDGSGTAYRADRTDGTPEAEGPWKPSIFMTRARSRITLEITDVRVEKLNAISEEDAKAEGCTVDQDPFWQPTPQDPDSGGHRAMGVLQVFMGVDQRPRLLVVVTVGLGAFFPEDQAVKEFFLEKRFGAQARGLLEVIHAVLGKYASQGYDLSLRQLYYQLVAANVVENTERSS